MNILKVDIQNFFRTKHMVVEFFSSGIINVEGENRDTGVSNETGKSTIFEAICWCLFGRYTSGGARAGDEVVNPQVGRDCIVQVLVDIGSEIICFERGRKKNKKTNYFKILQAGSEEEFGISGKDVSASNKAVVDILGIDYETFVRGHYFPQTAVLPFGFMTDSELKRFFVDKLLDIGWIDKCLVTTKNRKKLIDAGINDISDSISQLKAKVDAFRVMMHQAKANSIEWQQVHKERIEDANSNIAKSESEKTDCLTKYESVRLRLEAIPKPEQQNEVLSELEKEITESQNGITSLKSNMAVTKHQYEKAKSNFDSSEREVSKANSKLGSQCPECGSVITEDHIHFMADVYVERRDKFKQEANSHRENYNGMGKSLDHLMIVNSGLCQKRDELKGEMRKEAKEYNNVQNELFSAEKRVNEASSKLSYNLERLETIQKEKDPHASAITEAEQNITAIESRIEEKTIEYKSLQVESERLEKWVIGFSQQGIQSFLLDSVTPVLNSRLAYYLSDLSNGRIKARFETVTQDKAGNWKDKFKLMISNMDGGEGYQSLSGGAKRRVDLACALAVSDVKRSMTSNSLEFFVFDECFSFLDSFWLDRFLNLIQRDYRKYVTCIVSHQELEESYFDRKIHVVKENGETKLES